VQPSPTLAESLDNVMESLVLAPQHNPRTNTKLAKFPRKQIEIELLERLPLGTPEEQLAIVRLLAVFGSDASLEVLLAKSEHEVLRHEALASTEVIAGVARWPELAAKTTSVAVRRAISERLIAALDDRDPTVRLAATNAISKSFDCEVTEALIARVVERPSQNEESWFALFACRCPQANAFLYDAAQNPRLLGQFNNARLQWSLR